jgi:hypothetical protein
MVSIMAILTAKGTREVCLKIVVVLPLAFVVISPLGVLVPLILVAPNRLVLLGVISLLVLDYYCFSFFLSFWHYSTDGMDFPYSVVQNFELLNGRGLNKVNPSMWLSLWRSNGLWRTGNGKYGLFCGNDP